MKNFFFLILIAFNVNAQQAVYQDVPYNQDFSVKHYLKDTTLELSKVFADRNGVVQVLSSKGLLQPSGGQFQYPGTLEPVRAYRPMADKKLAGLGIDQKQFVYLDDQTVLSNAWAGKLFARHGLSKARIFSPGADRFSFLVSDGIALKILQDSVVVWTGKLDNDKVKDIRFEAAKNRFWVLGEQSVSFISLSDKILKTVFRQPGLTCFEIVKNQLYLGTHDG
jgi:hypothetical protein